MHEQEPRLELIRATQDKYDDWWVVYSSSLRCGPYGMVDLEIAVSWRTVSVEAKDGAWFTKWSIHGHELAARGTVVGDWSSITAVKRIAARAANAARAERRRRGARY